MLSQAICFHITVISDGGSLITPILRKHLKILRQLIDILSYSSSKKEGKAQVRELNVKWWRRRDGIPRAPAVENAPAGQSLSTCLSTFGVL